MKKTVKRGGMGKAVASILAFSAIQAKALDVPRIVEDCVGITPDADRLLCYDQLAQTQATSPKASNTTAAGHATTGALPVPSSIGSHESQKRAADDSSFLANHWELGPANKRGVFNFRPHRENYLLATYNPSPNQDPYRPFRALTAAEGLSHAELAFQLSFKLKMAENVANQPVDLWFGYTQRSFWQASNQEASSPFRETDYQPEVMAVVPVRLNVLGLNLRMLSIGVAHQSNGQSSSLSRSWNRAYVQAGFERGNFDLSARIWKRFNESASEDDNPNITDYMGRGDLVGTYRRNGHEFSMLIRHNFQTDKGATQLSWAFPIASKLKGYVQYFTGYGYTLIDYNDFQRVLGIGVQVDY